MALSKKKWPLHLSTKTPSLKKYDGRQRYFEEVYHQTSLQRNTKKLVYV
jgi:isocitrate dehydrogenase